MRHRDVYLLTLSVSRLIKPPGNGGMKGKGKCRKKVPTAVMETQRADDRE
jgi:hypothetical protein